MARLGFTGDVMLGRLVDERQRFEEKPASAVWGSVFDRLRALDGLFVNLECCLSTRGKQWTRTYDESKSRAVLADQLARAREFEPDLLVASLHWGPNMVETPPRRFQRLAHWLAEQGVDVIHGHSAHVFQGVEVYDGSLVLYDCGDFVDDYAVDPNLRNDRGFLFEVSVEADELVELRLIPTEIHDCAVQLANGGITEWSRQRMRDLSKPFGTKFEQDGEALLLSL